VLNLGELNTTQTEQWQRSIEVIEAEGQSRQRRLFTDREGRAPADATDACEVILSSLSVRRPREFGACWKGPHKPTPGIVDQQVHRPAFGLDLPVQAFSRHCSGQIGRKDARFNAVLRLQRLGQPLQRGGRARHQDEAGAPRRANSRA
jgi:hypothetical protein